MLGARLDFCISPQRARTRGDWQKFRHRHGAPLSMLDSGHFRALPALTDGFGDGRRR